MGTKYYLVNKYKHEPIQNAVENGFLKSKDRGFLTRLNLTKKMINLTTKRASEKWCCFV